MYHTRLHVAPYDIIQKDFIELDALENLRTNWDTERLILLQSVQGHAHEGHRVFNGMKYPNTTIDDISRSLRLDPAWVRSERQKLIDDVYGYVDRVIAGDTNAPLANQEGEPLLKSSMFRTIQVSGTDVLKGLYLGGLRDDAKVRFDMESKYGITIGGGKCFLVDTEVMDKMGLTGDVLAHSEHGDMIDSYKKSGLIVGEEGPDSGNLEYMYIRFRRGLGASDDTAIIAAGKIYGIDVAVGVFLADMIDTLEKHVPVFSDQDNRLARSIKDRFPDATVSDAELRQITYLSATPENAPIPVPDCSLRHMLSVDRSNDITTMECHFQFIQSRKYPHLHIGSDQVPNGDYYHYVEERLASSPGPL